MIAWAYHSKWVDGVTTYREPVWLWIRWMRPSGLVSLVFWHRYELEQYGVTVDSLVTDKFGRDIYRILTCRKSHDCLSAGSLLSFFLVDLCSFLWDRFRVIWVTTDWVRCRIGWFVRWLYTWAVMRVWMSCNIFGLTTRRNKWAKIILF